MPAWFLDTVLPALLSGLGALGAGLFGVRVGLARYRAERAFDRRMEWHDRAAAEAMNLYMRTAEVEALYSLDRPAPDQLMAVARASDTYTATLLLGRVYASRVTFQKLEELGAEHERLVNETDRWMHQGVERLEVAYLLTQRKTVLKRIHDLICDAGRSLLPEVEEVAVHDRARSSTPEGTANGHQR